MAPGRTTHETEASALLEGASPAPRQGARGFLAAVVLAVGAVVALIALAPSSAAPAGSTPPVQSTSEDAVGDAIELFRREKKAAAPLAVGPQMCTDGYMFNMSVMVKVATTACKESVDLLTSSTGAFDFQMVNSQFHPGHVKFTMKTLDGREWAIKSAQSVKQHEWNKITVAKTRDGALCISVQGPGDKAAKEICHNSNFMTPADDLQMMDAGKVKYGDAEGLETKDFKQTAGSIPMVYGISQKLEKKDIAKIADGTAKVLADETGNIVAAPQVAVAVSSIAAGDHKGDALVYATIYLEGANTELAGKSPCEVQEAMRADALKGSLEDALGLQVADGGPSAISNVIIPSPALECSKFTCEESEALLSAAKSTCRGGTCSATCCKPAPMKSQELPKNVGAYKHLKSVVAHPGMSLKNDCIGCSVERCCVMCDNTAGCGSFTFDTYAKSCTFFDKIVTAEMPQLTEEQAYGKITYYKPVGSFKPGKGTFMAMFDSLDANSSDADIMKDITAQLQSLGMSEKCCKEMKPNVTRMGSSWDDTVKDMPLAAKLLLGPAKMESVVVSLEGSKECYTSMSENVEGEVMTVKESKGQFLWCNHFNLNDTVMNKPKFESLSMHRRDSVIDEDASADVDFIPDEDDDEDDRLLMPKLLGGGLPFMKKPRPEGAISFATDGFNFKFSFDLKVNKLGSKKTRILGSENRAIKVETVPGKHNRGKLRMVGFNLNHNLMLNFVGCDVESEEFFAGHEHTVTITKTVDDSKLGGEMVKAMSAITGKDTHVDTSWITGGDLKHQKCCITIKPKADCAKHIIDWYLEQWPKGSMLADDWGKRCSNAEKCEGKFQVKPFSYVYPSRQLKRVGKLENFEQLDGSYTISFVVSVPSDTVDLESSIKKSLAISGGLGCMPDDITCLLISKGSDTFVTCTIAKGTESMESMQASGGTYSNLKRSLESSLRAQAGVKVTANDFSIPAKIDECQTLGSSVCGDFHNLIKKPMKCYGASCHSTCCKATTCSQVKCNNLMFNNPITKWARCNGEDDCREKCCLLPCAKYECGECGKCKCPLAALKAVQPSKAPEKCCKDMQCCQAPIAWCVACKKCEPVESYCLSKLLEFGHLRHHRRLRGDQSPALPEPETPASQQAIAAITATAKAKAEAKAQAFQKGDAAKLLGLSEVQSKAIVAPGGLDKSKQLMSDERIRLEMRRKRVAVAPRRLSSGGKVEGVGMADKIKNMWDEAKEYFKANHDGDGGKKSEVSGYSQKDADQTKFDNEWKSLYLEAKAKHVGLVCGCQKVPGIPCPWILSTMFLLHRGCDLEPKSVNTVQVMSDTRHAVTCGSDTNCWIWNLRTGAPRMIFGKAKGSVQAVAYTNDAAFVVSAGFMEGGPNGKANMKCGDEGKGQAFVWQWLRGSTFICSGVTLTADAAFLSAATPPMKSVVLIGGSNGYTYEWHYEEGADVILLPWGAHSFQDLTSKYETLINNIKGVVDGWTWLAIQKACLAHHFFLHHISKNPKVAEALDWRDKVYNFFHKNRMGPVNAIAYVPTNVRFVTGHGDGRIRYWSSTTGRLLMCMRGHQGPVRAIAGAPAAQKAVSGGDDGTIRVWCLQTGIQYIVMRQSWGGPVLSVAIVPGGTKIVAGSADGYIRIWDINTGLMLCQINTFGGPVNSVAVNPSNPLGQIVAANQDGYARVYNPM